LLTEAHIAVLYQMLRDVFDNPDREGLSGALVQSLPAALFERAIELWYYPQTCPSSIGATALFEHGVQLQWLNQLHECGQKKAARTFISGNAQYSAANHNSSKYKQLARPVADVVLDMFNTLHSAYVARLGAATVAERFNELFQSIVAHHADQVKWLQVPQVFAALEAQLTTIKQAPVDGFGLFIIKSSDTELFAMLDLVDTEHAIIDDFFTTVLHSTAANSFVMQYLRRCKRLAKPQTRLVKRQTIAKVTEQLLAISESAFWLPFVRQHCFNNDQTLLTPFLKPRLLAGPFRPGFESYEQEVAKQVEIDQELAESGATSHEEYMHITYVHGLRRLLPLQSELLADDHLRSGLCYFTHSRETERERERERESMCVCVFRLLMLHFFKFFLSVCK
jgi:hypothetical protein